jgi:PAS domain S-box-containing protein
MSREKHIWNSEAYFRSVFDNALYGIATTIGTDFRFVRVNDAFCELLEYDRDELEGVRSIADVTLPDDYPRNRHLLTRLINNEIQRFQIEKQYVAKSGRCIDVVVYVQGFYGDDGEYIGSTGSIMDITKRKQVEEDLQELAGRLLSVQEEERRRLARELHDDLAQRMALLVMEIERIDTERCDSEVSVIVRKLKDKLIDISEDIHRISRRLHPSIIEDLGLVEALRSEITNFSRLEGIPVSFEPGPGSVDPPMNIAVTLFRVTQESLRNIGKHAHAGNVTIQLARKNGSLLLIVSDNGRGFAPDAVKNLPGLGLKSMRERMRLVNGSISYTSRQGQGTIVEARIDTPT